MLCYIRRNDNVIFHIHDGRCKSRCLELCGVLRVFLTRDNDGGFGIVGKDSSKVLDPPISKYGAIICFAVHSRWVNDGHSLDDSNEYAFTIFLSGLFVKSEYIRKVGGADVGDVAPGLHRNDLSGIGDVIVRAAS